jgi:hypothetical protein
MNHRIQRLIGAALLIGVVALTAPGFTQASPMAPSRPVPVHTMPVRGQARIGGMPVAARRVKIHGNGIDHHGGQVMPGAVHAYVIWYGDWAKAPAKQRTITGFLGALAHSPYYAIISSYTNGVGRVLSNDVTLAGQTTDSYSQGAANLSDGAIKDVVVSAISSGRLPKDVNGVYFVLTSSDVTKAGFLTNYCGWHSYTTIRGTSIKFSFVGDPSGPKLRSCASQTTGPNGDAGADAMVSVIAHELEETVTDPQLDAWYDSTGAENADKCAWSFGSTYTVNGALANVHLGARDFLVQQNWLNAAGGSCVLATP